MLEVRDLVTQFRTERGIARAVNGVSFNVYENEVLGIVGESGSGKSVTALSIMRLIPNPPGLIAGGSIKLHADDAKAALANRTQPILGISGKSAGAVRLPINTANAKKAAAK